MTTETHRVPSSSWLRSVRAVWHFLVDQDHLTHVNKYLPWRYAFSCLCLVAAVAAICGIWVHAHAHALLGGVGLVLVVGTAWPWLSTRGLSGSVSFDRRRAREGERVGVRLGVRNWSPVGAWGVRVCGGLGTGDQGISLAVVPGWRHTQFSWEFTPICRGQYPLVAPRTSTGFPFGLWEASRPLSTESSLLVWPATFAVNGVPELTSNSRSREGVVPQNRVGTSGDLMGVRPYRRGDPRRRIHWGQTARHDQLIVCEQQATASPRIQLILDAHGPAHAGGRPDGSLEWAIRIVASVAESMTRQGVLVEGVWAGQCLPADTGMGHRDRLLDSLARLNGNAPPLEELLRLPACRQFTDGLQLVVTTDRALADYHGIAALPRLRLVVLRTAAFGGEPSPTWHGGAWIVLDDASRVAEQFRHGWREVQCAN